MNEIFSQEEISNLLEKYGTETPKTEVIFDDEVPVKSAEDRAIGYLIQSGWLENHDKEISTVEYNRGYDDAVNAFDLCTKEELKNKYKTGVDDGRNEAWEAARKIVVPWDGDWGGLNVGELNNIFESDLCTDVIKNFSVSEVIEKISEWEKKKAKKKELGEIKVGDEVVDEYGERWVVTREPHQFGVNGTMLILIWRGDCLSTMDVNRVEKTGRHFDQIAEVLDAMREDE